MRRVLSTLPALLALMLAISVVSAQTGTPQEGDPPVASLISVSAPDANGIVTITGAAGAVYPGAQVAIRNLYTEDTVYVGAGITGTFSAQIFGPGSTPFWVSPAKSLPGSVRGIPGALPGGPGTIVYGNIPLTPDTTPITKLIIDGDLSDWVSLYPSAVVAAPLGIPAYTLINQNSLYLAISLDTPPQDYRQFRVTFTLGDLDYDVTLDPSRFEAATLRRLSAPAADLGTLPVAAAQGAALELRIPLDKFKVTVSSDLSATLDKIQYLGRDEMELLAENIGAQIPVVDEVDGIVYPGGPMGADAQRFTVAGMLAQDSTHWRARGRVSALSVAPGDEWKLEMDVTMDVPQLADSLVGLRMIGRISLQPVIDSAGLPAAGGLDSSNGWSSLLTPSGLAIDNVRGDFTLAEATAAPQTVIRRGSQLTFGLRFDVTLPDDLPAGVYIPIFSGFGQVGDGDIFAWVNNSPLGAGTQGSRVPQTRLPLTLGVGQIPQARLLWSLFYNTPSDGSRGVLADEDAGHVALSNRVRFNSPTYILPPGQYPIEPYLPAELPNASDTVSTPLVPLLFPGGRLTGQVTLPSGDIDDLGSVAVAQVQLSSAATDGSAVFGTRSPIDVMRLASLNPSFAAYPFSAYGDYTINLTGTVTDVWGNNYTGGGTYHLLVAELLDLTPGVLPGTPFEVGDSFFAGARIAPGVPADVTVHMRVFPLDGGDVVDRVFEGQADPYGFFDPGEAFTFDTPGEYVVDYEARYTAADGTLWAASLRSAGVIARPQPDLIAHGRRGVEGYYGPRSGHFDTATYPGDIAVAPRPNYPYYAGDVAFVPDSADSGIRPIIQVQDVGGRYANWFITTRPDYTSPLGSIGRLAAEDALPLVPVLGGMPSAYGPALLPDLIANEAYGYISAVRPDVSVRQFVHGGDDDGLLVSWDEDDPYNGQIGAGATGDSPGDYTFLFGGAVVRNAEAGVNETAIYASLAVTVDSSRTASVQPPYLGEAGGGSGGPLMTIGNQDVEMFFHPTGTQPGQTVERGQKLVIAGQVAPTLTTRVDVTVTSPSGTVRQFGGSSNSIGYYYNPADDFALNEVGVWTVDIHVEQDGLTAEGPVEAPFPQGGVLGVDGAFNVYVVPPGNDPLSTNQGGTDAVNTPVRAGAPINFSVDLPRGLSDYHAYYMVRTAGIVMDSGELRLAETSANYQYNPALLNRTFPNLETDQRTVGEAASDVVTVTFVVTGLDDQNQTQIYSRTFTIMHDKMYSFKAAGDAG